jgi:hypothetical protein
LVEANKNERGPGEARLCGYENTTRSKAEVWRFSGPNPEVSALPAAEVYLCEYKSQMNERESLYG